MRHTLPLVVTLLVGISAIPAVPTRQDRKAESPAKLLASSRTICVSLSGPPELGTEISNQLRTWGRLREVSRPDEADLVLRVATEPEAVTAYSEFRHDEAKGVAFAGVVTHRESATKLWSSSKGGTWQGSDGRGSWAGRALARDFIKYFENTVGEVTDGVVVTPRAELPIFKGPITWVLPEAPCPVRAGDSQPRVSSVIAPPPLLDYEAPEYSAAARDGKVVVLELEIGTDGRVNAAKRVVLPHRPNAEDELVDAAIRAVKKWRFARACFEGVAIPLIHVVGVKDKPLR